MNRKNRTKRSKRKKRAKISKRSKRSKRIASKSQQGGSQEEVDKAKKKVESAEAALEKERDTWGDEANTELIEAESEAKRSLEEAEARFKKVQEQEEEEAQRKAKEEEAQREAERKAIEEVDRMAAAAKAVAQRKEAHQDDLVQIEKEIEELQQKMKDASLRRIQAIRKWEKDAATLKAVTTEVRERARENVEAEWKGIQQWMLTASIQDIQNKLLDLGGVVDQSDNYQTTSEKIHKKLIENMMDEDQDHGRMYRQNLEMDVQDSDFKKWELEMEYPKLKEKMVHIVMSPAEKEAMKKEINKVFEGMVDQYEGSSSMGSSSMELLLQAQDKVIETWMDTAEKASKSVQGE